MKSKNSDSADSKSGKKILTMPSASTARITMIKAISDAFMTADNNTDSDFAAGADFEGNNQRAMNMK